MEKDKREQLKKKMKLHKKLGAIRFQKVVFEVERMKYKTIKTICPNVIRYYDKYCDFQKKIAIKHATSEEQIKKIQKNTKFNKLAIRKEFNQEKNRNYHMRYKKPTEIIKYLEWNKKVHQRGLIKDAVVGIAIVGGSIVFTPWLLPLLGVTLASAAVNFECINIQDFNLCRYKIIEDRLKQQEEQRQKEIQDNYQAAGEMVYEKLESKDQIPTTKEVLDSRKNDEQAREWKEFLLKEIRERQIESQIEKQVERPMVKVKGGIK